MRSLTTQSHPRRRRADAGFTLTELMVVMIIFGIVTAIGLPGLNKFLRSLDLNGEVQRTASLMRVTRQRAITENNNYCLYWDDTEQCMAWFDDDNNDGTKQGTEKRGALGRYPGWITVTEVGTNPFSADTVIFYPNGSTNTSGSLLYTNSDGYSRSLSVVRPTGMVTVQ
jgi:prepilin-type N-terminal cleavage/methylation domain-containing protein